MLWGDGGDDGGGTPMLAPEDALHLVAAVDDAPPVVAAFATLWPDTPMTHGKRLAQNQAYWDLCVTAGVSGRPMGRVKLPGNSGMVVGIVEEASASSASASATPATPSSYWLVLEGDNAPRSQKFVLAQTCDATPANLKAIYGELLDPFVRLAEGDVVWPIV